MTRPLPPLKTVLLSLWIFLGGPLVWGAWMVFRLRIITLDGFLACLLPSGAALLLGFLALNFLIQGRSAGAAAVRRHFLLLAAFGSVGTFGFLALGALTGLAGPGHTSPDWLARCLPGAASGAALVALFYPLMNANLLAGRCDAASLRLLRRCNRLGFVLGMPAWFASAAWAGMFDRINTANLASLVLPVLTATLLLWRSSRFRAAGA